MVKFRYNLLEMIHNLLVMHDFSFGEGQGPLDPPLEYVTDDIAEQSTKFNLHTILTWVLY